MKYEIMIGILFDLLSKKCVSAKFLAEKYGVSVRSIYRYINSLCLANVPIYTVHGKNGGFAIVDTYKLSSTFMTVDEFEHTINALSAICGSVPDKILLSAINKLKSAVKNEYSGFDIKSGNLIIDGGPWGDTVGYKSKLLIINKSINESKKLEIIYHDRNGEQTTRIIEPHIVLFKQGIWYVYAYCNLRKEFRFFKTGRIQSANLLNQVFIRQDISNMDLPLDFWHNSSLCSDVVLKIDKTVLSDVEEWLGIECISTEGDYRIARVKLPIDNGLVSKILGFGSGITVIEPKELKEQVLNNALAVAKMYGVNE